MSLQLRALPYCQEEKVLPEELVPDLIAETKTFRAIGGVCVLGAEGEGTQHLLGPAERAVPMLRARPLKSCSGCPPSGVPEGAGTRRQMRSPQVSKNLLAETTGGETPSQMHLRNRNSPRPNYCGSKRGLLGAEERKQPPAPARSGQLDQGPPQGIGKPGLSPCPSSGHTHTASRQLSAQT